MAEHHKHILVTGYTLAPLMEDSVPIIEQWFRDLVKAVDMNILVEPKAVWCDTEGNEGTTGCVVIDTSHSSLHAWVAPEPYFKFDLYSCKDYAVETVFGQLKKLGAYRVSYMVVDRRGDDHVVLESGKRNI